MLRNISGTINIAFVRELNCSTSCRFAEVVGKSDGQYSMFASLKYSMILTIYRTETANAGNASHRAAMTLVVSMKVLPRYT